VPLFVLCALCFATCALPFVHLETPLGPAPLTLADDSHMLGTAAMAAVANVTDETLYQWHKRGCPCDISEGGTRRWNKGAVLAWREKNRPEQQMKGGKRKNAGRKRGAASRIKAMAMAESGAGAGTEHTNHSTARASGRIAVGEVVDAIGGGGGQLSIGALVDDEVKRRADEIVSYWGDMKGIMALIKAGGLNVIESQTLAKVVEAQAKHLELKKAEGSLVDAEEVKLALGHALSKVRAVLDQTPDRTAARVISECGLKGTEIYKVRRVVAEEMRRACDGLKKALGEEATPPEATKRRSDEGIRHKPQSTEHK